MRIVFVGGVGGSGTRVVASLLSSSGVFIGSNLNVSLDNMDWPGDQLTIKDAKLTFEQKIEALRLPFQQFIEKMINDQYKTVDSNQSLLAIKVPGSFFYLPYLCEIFDDVSYIHVIRHGLDMAFSDNKNQLKNWGGVFNVFPEDISPEIYQLKYWLRANEYAVDMGVRLLNDKFYLLRYESLCDDPESEMKELSVSLTLDLNFDPVMLNTVKRPKTFNRYLQKDLTLFEDKDLASLKNLGYEI